MIPEEQLFDAVTVNDLPQVESLLASHPNLNINWTEPDFSRTCLIRACFMGHSQMVKRLLAHPEIQVNQVQSQRCTALYLACQEGRVEALKVLLADPRTDVNLSMRGAFTPLGAACIFNHPEIVRELLGDPRLIVTCGDSMDYPLMIAAEQNQLEAVKMLVKDPRVDVNFATNYGETALSVACDFGHLRIVEELIKIPQVELKPVQGLTPFQRTCYGDRVDVARCLLAYRGADIDTTPVPAYHHKVLALLETVNANRHRELVEMRRQYKLLGLDAAMYLAVLSFVADGYLGPKTMDPSLHRFVKIVRALPFDLVMVLSNRMAFLGSFVVSGTLTREALTKVSRSFAS